MKFDVEFLKNTFFIVLTGIPLTFKLCAVVLIISLIFGFLVAIGRKNKNSPLARILSLYVSFARGTPIMVQIYLLYTAFPTVIARTVNEKGWNFDIYSIKGITYAYVIFSFSMIPIMSEMFRGALAAIDKGQLEAAKSVGLSSVTAYRRIVMPQAIVYSLPVLCTNITGLVKMSSLAFSLSVFEITAIAKTEGAKHTCYVEAYLIIAVMYVVINLTIELIFKIIEKRVKRYHVL